VGRGLEGVQGRFVVDRLLRPLLPAENSGWRSWWMKGEASAGYPWRVYVHVRCRLGTSSLMGDFGPSGVEGRLVHC
jgi:hypothetical protein